MIFFPSGFHICLHDQLKLIRLNFEASSVPIQQLQFFQDLIMVLCDQ